MPVPPDAPKEPVAPRGGSGGGGPWIDCRTRVVNLKTTPCLTNQIAMASSVMAARTTPRAPSVTRRASGCSDCARGM